MAQRAFRQQVDGLSPTADHPIYALTAIDETQHLHTIGLIDLGRITADHAYGLLLALRHAGRSHLNAIDVEIVEQHAGDDQFLMRQETDTAGLLAVAQRGVHNLHEGLQAIVLSYLFCCSHNSVFS